MECDKCENCVELCGTVAETPMLSHENHGERFYRFALRVERLSGQADLPVVLASGKLLSLCPVERGMPLRVSGQLRSFNNKSGIGSRLVITVFARTLEQGDDMPCNCIRLSGALCKTPVLRRTPLGRSICDMVLAVNRRYGRADYLPCIAWGQTAAQVAAMGVGEWLALEGRVQSRTYLKQLPHGAEERTAYEVSVMRLTEEASLC